MVRGINRRKRGGASYYEYYVRKKRIWMTLEEMAELKEVEICPDSIRKRFNNNHTAYVDVWHAITCFKTKSNKIDLYIPDDEFIEFMNLWPVGSLCEKHRIMDSR